MQLPPNELYNVQIFGACSLKWMNEGSFKIEWL